MCSSTKSEARPGGALMPLEGTASLGLDSRFGGYISVA
jgi:hypothetical protein